MEGYWMFLEGAWVRWTQDSKTELYNFISTLIHTAANRPGWLWRL